MGLRAHRVKIMESHIEGQAQLRRQIQNGIGQAYKVMKVQTLNAEMLSKCSAGLQEAVVSDRNLQVTLFTQPTEPD